MTLQPLTSEAISNGIRTPAPEIAQIPEIDYPDSDGNPMSDNTEQERLRANRLADRLIALGIDPEL